MSIFFFADLNNPEMWEFGELARSIYSGSGYSYPALTTMVPSAHMPPGLPFIYYLFFLFFGDNPISYAGILVLNSIIISFAVVISYLIAEIIYDKKNAFFTALYVSISPIYLYATISFNSIVYYFLLIGLCYFYFLKLQLKIHKIPDTQIKNVLHDPAFLISVSLAVFLYFRSEIIILCLFVFSYFISKRKYRTALLIISVSLIFILPWTIRNYTVFGRIIPVSTSAGMNFYYGHGDEKYDALFKKQIAGLKEDNTFEIRKSDIAYGLAFDYIKNNPYAELRESASKLWSFWITDKYRAISKNPLYLIVWLPTLLFFIIGYFYSMKDEKLREKMLFVNVMIIFSVFIVLIFFNIPRYQIQLSYLLIPAAVHGAYSTLKKIFYANNKINKT